MDNGSYDKIKEEIFNAVFENNGKCFLLLDATLKQYQSDSSFYSLLNGQEYHLITFQLNELQDALPLYLVPLDAQDARDNELFDSSVQHALNELDAERINAGEGRSICAWISTLLTQEQLSESISRSAVQSVRSDNDVLIRYFDPSVIGLMLPILDNWQKQQLLSNINSWCYIDGDGVAQIVNGDGGSLKKLNYSLGLTESNLSEINNILIINNILREYRKAQFIERVSESEAAKLLHPAISYFNAHFSSSGNGIVEFGLDVLSAQKLFYQDGVFDRYIQNVGSKNFPLYTDVKSRLGALIQIKEIAHYEYSALK